MNESEARIVETAKELTLITRPYPLPDNPDNHTQDECASLDDQADANE